MLFNSTRFSQSIALSFGLMIATTIIISPAIAVTPINSTQDSAIINGGTYYNTLLGKTTFTNSHGGGLWLKAGTELRGLQVDDSGHLTNNGGIFQFYAPKNVVRLDGNVNVNGLVNGSGTYIGNGGQVFIDAGYLFQNGNIYANGMNGGLVQASVAGMTVGSGAHIEAKGFWGNSGAVLFSSSGPVDIRRGAVIDTSGRVAGMVDTNVIAITGSLVNQEGVLKANGAAQSDGTRGGTIQLTASGQSDLTIMKEALSAATGTTTSNAISPQERIYLLQRNDALIRNFDGDVRLGRTNNGSISVITANGGTNGVADPVNDHTLHAASGIPRAGDGGTILISAARDIINEGVIQANGATGQSSEMSVAGGYGGTVALVALRNIDNRGEIHLDGGNSGGGSPVLNPPAGTGGLAAFGYGGLMSNSGSITVNGGQGGGYGTTQEGDSGFGGLMVFSGDQNPVGNGYLTANAGTRSGVNNLAFGGPPGTIVVPNPLTIQTTQHTSQKGYINGLSVNQRVTQATQDNELLTHDENLIFLGRGTVNQAPLNLFDRFGISTYRSVLDPTGQFGEAHEEITGKAKPDPTLNGYVYRNWMVGGLSPNTPLDLSPPAHAIPLMANLTDLSALNSVTVVNKGDISVGHNASSNFWMLGNFPILSGRRLHLLAQGNVTNTTDLGALNDGPTSGAIVIAATQSIRVGNGNYGTLFTDGAGHAGTMILKAARDLTVSGRTQFDADLHSTGGLIGGTNLYQAGRNINLGSGSFVIAAGGPQGGWVDIRAGNNLLSQGHIVTSGSGGVGGFTALHADNSLLNTGSIESTGRSQGGTILLTAGDHNPNNNQRIGIMTLPVELQGFGISRLTPSLSPVSLTANGQQSESVFSLGFLDVRAEMVGCNTGKIYLGGNNQVVLAASNMGTSYNQVTIPYQQIVNSPSPNTAFQALFNRAGISGEKLYVVAGQQISGANIDTNRSASDIVESEAGPNGTAPNVNPAQSGQGAVMPTDFELQSD